MIAGQGHMFETFERAPPLRRKVPPAGFRWCEPCNGTGHLYDPPRPCRDCEGMGHVLDPEARTCRYCREPVIRNIPCGCERAQEEARRIRNGER